MAVLYVTEQGASIRKVSKRLLIVKDEQILQVARAHEIERVLLFGNIQITTQAMAFLLDEGIETSFLSSQGRFRGRLTPADSKNVPLRIAQYQRYLDENFRLSMACRIVLSKIKNGRSLLLKYGQNHPEVNLYEEIKQLEIALNSVDNQESIQSLMGVEGQAAAIYFQAYGRMFRKELQFSVRTRRPPKDPINALLSLGYTLLTNEAASMLAAHGMDIHIGNFHSIEYGRPSLALDLVEEFRQPVVDRFTISLANKRVFTEEDFSDKGDEGVFLHPKSLKRYFALYERMLTASFKDRTSSAEATFRSLIQCQAQRMAKAILQQEDYEPFLLS
jgi:CRISPR-associated protein Cas1